MQCECVDPDNQGPAAPKCGQPDYKGDGNCDDENNNAGCWYDGGDCCPETVEGGKVSTTYCKEVLFGATFVYGILFYLYGIYNTVM